MAVYLTSIIGSPSIGVYSLATENFVIIPKMVPEDKAAKTAEWLNAKLIHTTIGGSLLIGALACANSNGIILSPFVRQENSDTSKPLWTLKLQSWRAEKQPSATCLSQR